MKSCEIAYIVSSLACALSQSCDEDELVLLVAAFTQLGDTLTTILATK